MQALDECITIFFQGLRRDQVTDILYFFIPLELWTIIACVLALLFFVLTKKLRVPFISFFLAAYLSNFCTHNLKVFFQRPRPYCTVEGAIPVISAHGYSFPSGHATAAMAMAVVLIYYFPKARIPMLTLALITGISRIYFGVHFTSDVLAGFILGAALGLVSIYLERAMISVTKSRNA